VLKKLNTLVNDHVSKVIKEQVRIKSAQLSGLVGVPLEKINQLTSMIKT